MTTIRLAQDPRHVQTLMTSFHAVTAKLTKLAADLERTKAVLDGYIERGEAIPPGLASLAARLGDEVLRLDLEAAASEIGCYGEILAGEILVDSDGNFLTEEQAAALEPA